MGLAGAQRGRWRVETFSERESESTQYKGRIFCQPRYQHWDGLPWAVENFLVVEMKGGAF